MERWKTTRLEIGIAIATNNQIIKKRMRSQSSIYSAEQQAIITAMESTTRKNKSSILATDSLSSLLAASGNKWTGNPKTTNIIRLLDNPRNYIKLIWVPSHIGIGGNDAADQAAKDALNEEIRNQEPYPLRTWWNGWKKWSLTTEKKDGKEVKMIWNIGRHQEAGKTTRSNWVGRNK
jgi:ribonuclease HI